MARNAASSPKQPLLRADEQVNEGWPTFWLVILTCTLSAVVASLVLPDMATAYFNGGEDPCVGEGHNTPECDEAVQKAAAAGGGAVGVKAILSFAFSPLVGNLCDQFGRRPLLLAGSILMALIPFALLGVVTTGRPLDDAFLAVMITGFVPLQIPGSLWIADRTRPEERLAMFAKLAAFMDLENIAGPVLTSLCTRLQCIVFASVCGVVAPLVTLVSLPESLSDMQKPSSDTAQRQSYFSGFGLIFSSRELTVLTTMCFVGMAAITGGAPIILMYFKVKFGLTRETASPILAAFGFSALFVMVFLVKPLGRILGFRALIALSYMSGIAFLTVMIMAPTTQWLMVGVPFMGLSTSCQPAISALYLSIVPEHLRGRAQGALSSMMMLASFTGPMLYGSLFYFFLEPRLGLEAPFPAAPWLGMIIGDLFCLCILFSLSPNAFVVASDDDDS